MFLSVKKVEINNGHVLEKTFIYLYKDLNSLRLCHKHVHSVNTVVDCLVFCQLLLDRNIFLLVICTRVHVINLPVLLKYEQYKKTIVLIISLSKNNV